MNNNQESVMVATAPPADGLCEETNTKFDLPTIEQPTDAQQQQQQQQQHWTPNMEEEQETEISQLDGQNEAIEGDQFQDIVTNAQSQPDSLPQPQPQLHPQPPPPAPQPVPAPSYSQPLPLPDKGVPEQQQFPQPPPPPYMPQPPYGYNGYEHHFYPPQPFYYPPQGPGSYHQYPKAYYQSQGNYQNNRKNRNTWNNESNNKNIAHENGNNDASQNEDNQSQNGQAYESSSHTRNNSRDSNGGYRGRGRGRGRDRSRGRQRRDGSRSFGYYSNQANPHFFGQNGGYPYNGYQGYSMDNQGYYGMGYPGGPMGPYPPMDYMGYNMMGGYPMQTPPPYQAPMYGGMEQQNKHQTNYGNAHTLENGVKELSMHSNSYQDQANEGVVVVGTRNNADNHKKGQAVQNEDRSSGNTADTVENNEKEGKDDSEETEKAKPMHRIVPGLDEEDGVPQGKLSKSQAKRLRKKMRDQGQPKE
eukprot:TRINITY_DN4874_c0_g1_i10.p2 TRINITY_DN4874_c0_g1~~TRINITY_DN4874_c0_g1_i10.p2  ORF type:complete len:542 (-),score=68.33 TRINITY_DN4874_c0_g1_i10:1650-3065(-)